MAYMTPTEPLEHGTDNADDETSRLNTAVRADETRHLIATWRDRAARLDERARLYRADGDGEYAADLEQAAADNREAADRLEATL